MGDDKDGGRGKRGILRDLFLYSVHGREAGTWGEACLVFIGTWEFHTEVNKFFVMPFFIFIVFIHFLFILCLCLLCTLKLRRISMNYDEMRGKQGANLLNHVASLLGQDEFCFFPLLPNNGYCILRYCGDVKEPISSNSWG